MAVSLSISDAVSQILPNPVPHLIWGLSLAASLHILMLTDDKQPSKSQSMEEVGDEGMYFSGSQLID